VTMPADPGLTYTLTVSGSDPYELADALITLANALAADPTAVCSQHLAPVIDFGNHRDRLPGA
jgi:hypothetical protein